MPPATSVRSIHLDAGGGGGGVGGPAGYDQSLLAATPEVSKAAKQESYNVDLLETGGPTTHVIDPGLTTNNPTGQSGVNGANKEISYSSVANRSRGGEAYGEEERYFHHHRRPWLRRPVGLVTLAIIFIIIVGAIVGGAVGGTVGHHKNDSSAQQQQQQQGFGPTSAGNGSAQQGVGPSTSSSNGNATQGTSPQEQNVGGTPPNK